MRITPIPLICVISALVAGCASTKQTVWEKPGASSRDFEMDRAQCNAQAFSVPGGNLMTLAIIQNQCLRGKGWYLTDSPSGESNTIQRTNAQVQLIVNQMDALLAKPEYRQILEKSPAKTSDITFAQISDNTKITVSQRAIFLTYVTEIDELSSQIPKIIRESNHPQAPRVANLREATNVQRNLNRLNLLNQKITWGEFNLRRQEIDANYKRDIQQINDGK